MNEQYFTSLNGYYVKDKEAIHTYDSVAEMKSDSKIKEGSYVKTRGYYNPNDGGNGEYLIVNDDSLNDNGGSIHLLNNGLKAILIIDNVINVLSWGIKNDSSDSQSQITSLFNYYSDGNVKIYFPAGTYYLSETIYLPNKTEIIGDGSSSLIKWYGNADEYMIDILAGKERCCISNISLDGNNLANGIWDCDKTNTESTVYGIRTKIYNIWIDNTRVGIRMSAMGSEFYNITAYGCGDFNTNTYYGMFIDGTDNFINSCRILRYYTGVKIVGSNNRLLCVKSCVNTIGFEITPGNYGNYNIDSQENYQDNIIMENTIESVVVLHSQTAGVSNQYLTGNALLYSLVKMINCKHINISGVLNGRYKIANSYPNEKYGLYIDNDSTNIIGEFVYNCFLDRSIVPQNLDYPIFYVNDNQTNNINLNGSKLVRNNLNNITLSSIKNSSTVTSFTYTNNIFNTTFLSNISLTEKQICGWFTPQNIDNPCILLFETNDMTFSIDTDSLVMQMKCESTNRTKIVEIPVSYVSIGENGKCILRVNFEGLTAWKNQYEAQYEQELGGEITEYYLAYRGYPKKIENVQVTGKIIADID